MNEAATTVIRPWLLLVAAIATLAPLQSTHASGQAVHDITTVCEAGVQPAVADDGLDDAPGIQACVDAIKADGGGVLYIPTGVYDLEYESHSACTGTNNCSVNIVGVDNMTVKGDGIASVLRKSGAGAGASADWYMFIAGDNDQLQFRDFKVDGGWQGNNAITNVGEQTHEFQFSTGLKGSSSNVSFDRMLFYNSRGDCIRSVGSPTNTSSGFVVSNSHFIDCKRGGLGIQRGTTDFTITGNFFTGGTDQLIDFEPTSAGTVSHFTVSDNVFIAPGRTAVAYAGSNQNDHEQSTFSSNVVIGKLFLYNNSDISIDGNLVWDNSVDSSPLVDLRKSQTRIVVSDNTLVRGSGSSAGPVLRVAHHGTGFSDSIAISGNTILQQTNSTGIDLQTGVRYIIADNLLVYEGAAGFGNGIGFRTYAETTDQLAISGNVIHGAWSNSINISTNSGDLDALIISHNLLTGAATGVRFDASVGAILSTPMITGNKIDATTKAIAFGQSEYAVSGNTGSGMVVHLVGYAAPTSLCTPGSLYTATKPADAGTYICRAIGWEEL